MLKNSWMVKELKNEKTLLCNILNWAVIKCQSESVELTLRGINIGALWSTAVGDEICASHLRRICAKSKF